MPLDHVQGFTIAGIGDAFSAAGMGSVADFANDDVGLRLGAAGDTEFALDRPGFARSPPGPMADPRTMSLPCVSTPRYFAGLNSRTSINATRNSSGPMASALFGTIQTGTNSKQTMMVRDCVFLYITTLFFFGSGRNVFRVALPLLR